MRFQIRYQEPATGSPRVDELLCGHSKPSAHVSEVAFDRAWSNANELRRYGNRSAGGHEGCEDVDLARRRPLRLLAAQSATVHADRRAATSHSSRPSIGML